MHQGFLPIVAALVIGNHRAAASPPSPELDVDTLRAVLESDAHWVPWWFWGWSSIFATTGTVQLTLEVLADDPGKRADHAVGGVSAWLGLIGLPIGAMTPDVFIPVDDDPRALLRAIRQQARQEAAATGWLPHVLAVAVTTAGGLYLWLAEDRPLQAGIHFGLGIIAGEAQIWTVPTAALDWWVEAFPDEDP